MSILKAISSSIFGGNLPLRTKSRYGSKSAGLWEVKCIRPDGSIRWEDGFHNITVNEGRTYTLDVAFGAFAQDTTWFVGLLAATPSPVISWTSASLAAVDFVAYDEATLVAFVDGGTTIGSDIASIDNSGTTADFAINSNSSSIGGAFMIDTSTKATPAGTLYSAGAFTGGNKAADAGDTLQVTVTLTQADDAV